VSETPKLGDKVRVTYEGTAVDPGFGGIHLPGSLDLQGVLENVEILERADAPSKDPVGTVRTNDDSGRVFVKVRLNEWRILADDSCPSSSWSDSEVASRTVTGIVPGSPADKPQAEFYNGLNLSYRVQGDKAEYWDTSSLVWRSSIIEARAIRHCPVASDPSDGR
jgi:hypothetical protein